jgi:hypothetical protein
MSISFGDTSDTAVSQDAVTNKQRDVLIKQVNAGQQTVVATAPKRRDGGSLDVITTPFRMEESMYKVAEQIHKLLADYCAETGSEESATCSLRIASALWQKSSTVSGLHSERPSPEQSIV